MCRSATNRILALIAALIATAALCAPAYAFDWRHIGNASTEMSLAGVATGPMSRVWYSSDGAHLFAQTKSGRVFETVDFEQWSLVKDPGIAPPDRAKLNENPGLGRLGDTVSDAAVSPREPLEITAANRFGVWRSMDGGLSWSGLNESLPNFSARRILNVPAGANGLRVAVEIGSDAQWEWMPGEKTAWRPVEPSPALSSELKLRRTLTLKLGAPITAVATSGSYIYAGGVNGRLWASSDRGQTWQSRFTPSDEAGPVESIYVDLADPRLALATLGISSTRSSHVRRTINGGVFWDDLTTNLPDSPAHGITADRASGAVYVATGAGVFFTMSDLNAAAPATVWTNVGQDLPSATVADVKLDAAGNQLFVLVEGYGVYASVAPHRFREVRVVNSGDYSVRPAAPGALLSVLGARVESASSATASIPVLDATDSASQIQLPFELRGSSVSLTLHATTGQLVRTLPVQSASPALLISPDGAPLILDGDSGMILDAMNPARSGSRIQILATGLGRVTPDWQAGMAAPLNDPPRVTAPVRALLDRTPVEVTRAVLAPGYIGLYLIEVELPRIVNMGAAELFLDVDGHESNRVRIFIQP